MRLHRYPKQLRPLLENSHEDKVLKKMIRKGLDFLNSCGITPADSFSGDEFIHPERELLEYEINKIGMFDAKIPSIDILGMRRIALKHVMFAYRYGWGKYIDKLSGIEVQ